MNRAEQGKLSGHLKCCRCQRIKPTDAFYKHGNSWRSYCIECQREYKRAHQATANTKPVMVHLNHSLIDYMMTEMLPDGMGRSVGAMGAKLIRDAVAAHRQACTRLKAQPAMAQNGWPSKQALMGRR